MLTWYFGTGFDWALNEPIIQSLATSRLRILATGVLLIILASHNGLLLSVDSIIG